MLARYQLLKSLRVRTERKTGGIQIKIHEHKMKSYKGDLKKYAPLKEW